MLRESIASESVDLIYLDPPILGLTKVSEAVGTMSTVKHVRYSIETPVSLTIITVFGSGDENDVYKCAERLDKRLARS